MQEPVRSSHRRGPGAEGRSGPRGGYSSGFSFREVAVKKLIITTLILLGGGVSAEQPSQPSSAPDIPFDVQDVIRMPADLYLGEVAGVALNSKRHIFVYTRTGADEGAS